MNLPGSSGRRRPRLPARALTRAPTAEVISRLQKTPRGAASDGDRRGRTAAGRPGRRALPRRRRGRRAAASARARPGRLALRAPTLVVLGLFLVVPILMALWVSFTDWNGRGSPFGSSVGFVGPETTPSWWRRRGHSRRRLHDLAAQQLLLRALVVPLQTAFALWLALVLNQRMLKAAASSGPPSTSRRSSAPWPSAWCSSSSSPAEEWSTRCSPRSASTARPGSTTPGALHLVGDGLGCGTPTARRPPSPAAGCSACRGGSGSGPQRRPVGDHHAGRLDDHRHVHADVHGRPAGPPGRGRGGGRFDGAGRWRVFRNVTLPHLRPPCCSSSPWG